MKLEPQLCPEYQELMSLVRVDKNLRIAVRSILEEGLPLITADVDSLVTEATGDRVVTYKLPGRIHALFLAARAQHINSVDSPLKGNSGHDYTL